MTSFNSGTTFNVFPDDAILQGSLRTYSDEVKDAVKEKIKTIT